jgi:secernin
LIELIETHDQGGSGYRDVDWPYNNSFLIADARDAWILEAAGRHWAERRARSVDSISNQICIASDWDRLSAQAVERARECGFAVRDPFDFAAAYRDVDSVPRVLSEGRLRRSRALLSQGRGKLTPVLLREILRDHDRTGPHYIAGASPEEEQYYTLCMHQGPSRTAASVVAELTADRREPQTAWLSFGRPCASVYFPLVVAGRLPESLREGSETPGDTLWWAFERLAAQAEASDAHAKRIRAVFDDLEAAFADELDGLRRYTARLDAREQDDAATRFMDGVAARVESTARELVAAGT